MGRIVKITITCDRCKKPMAEEHANIWTWFDHRKKPFYKLLHEVPCWNRVDEFVLCDDCAQEFKKWMSEKKSTN